MGSALPPTLIPREAGAREKLVVFYFLAESFISLYIVVAIRSAC